MFNPPNVTFAYSLAKLLEESIMGVKAMPRSIEAGNLRNPPVNSLEGIRLTVVMRCYRYKGLTKTKLRIVGKKEFSIIIMLSGIQDINA